LIVVGGNAVKTPPTLALDRVQKLTPREWLRRFGN